MFTLIKELFNLRKSITEKEARLKELTTAVDNKDVYWSGIISEAKSEAQKEADKILADRKQEYYDLDKELTEKAKKTEQELNNRLTYIESEILKKDDYITEVEKIKDTLNKTTKQVETNRNKVTRAKSLYLAMEHTIDKFFKLEPQLSDLKLQEDMLFEINEFAPTVTLKLNCMDLKEMKKAFNANAKLIDQTLEKYSDRYTTKANAAIYKLMVIALKSELQNILYNLKYDKLEKSIDAVKITTTKYLKIASEGNQSIAPTLVKFIGEIEYLFIEAVHIEYEYYVLKERQKEEQAVLREQMRQEAEERKLLEQQKKQIEKEEEKYKNEINKIEELLSSTVDEKKLIQLQAKIAELNAQLESVEHKKEDIVKRQNGKAGYVYVISNLGSFGESVFKIGMTRRLDPQDRVNELGDASVPFTFDVHSFIFSEDAVALEQQLHNILDERRVNKVNLRKEFFKVSINELESLVTEINPTAEFNTTMLAEQYRQTLSINEESLVS